MINTLTHFVSGIVRCCRFNLLLIEEGFETWGSSTQEKDVNERGWRRRAKPSSLLIALTRSPSMMSLCQAVYQKASEWYLGPSNRFLSHFFLPPLIPSSTCLSLAFLAHPSLSPSFISRLSLGHCVHVY